MLAATGQPYVEALETRRYDAGALGQFLFKGRYVVTARAAVARQSHDHQFGEVLERDRHDTVFGEVAVRGTAGRQTWVAGLAIERDAYTARDVPRFDYTFTVPGAFAQYDITASPHLSLSASARLDVHSEYGTFFSPRVSALAHAGRWTSRFSVGTGFFGPTPLTEETEAAGLTRLEVRQPVEAERGLSASFDLSRTDGPLSYTATVFASRIDDPLHVERSPAYVLSTLPDPTTNVGLELLGTLRREPFSVTATYTYVQARETVNAIEQDVPLTPRHSAGIVGMWEAEDAGRVGIEWYYTGRQSLEENPYRAVSEPYMILGLLAEKQFGRIRLFVNGENLQASGRRDGIRCFSQHAPPTAAGPSTRGRRSTAGTSTAACGSVSRVRVRSKINPREAGEAGVSAAKDCSVLLNELGDGARRAAGEISDGGGDGDGFSACALIGPDRENAFNDGRRNAFSNAARPRLLGGLVNKPQCPADDTADNLRSLAIRNRFASRQHVFLAEMSRLSERDEGAGGDVARSDVRNLSVTDAACARPVTRISDARYASLVLISIWEVSVRWTGQPLAIANSRARCSSSRTPSSSRSRSMSVSAAGRVSHAAQSSAWTRE